MINLLIFITSPLYNNAKMEVPTNLLRDDLFQLLKAFNQCGQNPFDKNNWKVTWENYRVTFLCKKTGSYVIIKDELSIFDAINLTELTVDLYKESLKGE